MNAIKQVSKDYTECEKCDHYSIVIFSIEEKNICPMCFVKLKEKNPKNKITVISYDNKNINIKNKKYYLVSNLLKGYNVDYAKFVKAYKQIRSTAEDYLSKEDLKEYADEIEEFKSLSTYNKFIEGTIRNHTTFHILFQIARKKKMDISL